MPTQRDPRLLHPFIALKLEAILDAIQQALPQGYRCRLDWGHRTADEQFKLFKKGRAFQGGRWVVINRAQVVTYKDGYVAKSRHNYLPATAIDVAIYDRDGQYVSPDALYRHVGKGKNFGLDWGGDWQQFKDRPHLEIPEAVFFQHNVEQDSAYLWQQYLKKAGAYKGALDGIFGLKSKAALREVTGEEVRNVKGWLTLLEGWGVLAG